MSSTTDVMGRTYRWDGELAEDTKITIQNPDGEFAIRTFGALMGQSNGEILEVLLPVEDQ